MSQGLSWIGVGGVPPDDDPRAYVWERRLHWVMIGIALLSIPGFYLEELASTRPARILGEAIEIFILLAFTFELAWMLRITRHRAQYLSRNWLDVVVIAFTLASVVGFETQWVTLIRLTRVAIVGLLLMRAVAASRQVFRRGGLPYMLVFGFAALLLSGFGFYWLEPTVQSYGEGLWLAFVTGATIGYGDFVPTTVAARFFAVFIVLVGVATMSMLTANIAALLVGEDEARLRAEMQQDIRQMREALAGMIDAEERTVVRELHRDIRELRGEIARLREEVRRARGPGA